MKNKETPRQKKEARLQGLELSSTVEALLLIRELRTCRALRRTQAKQLSGLALFQCHGYY